MKLRHRIDISASPQTVWPLVADPQLQGQWNRNIIAVRRTPAGPAQAGERFDMTYRMSGRDRHSRVTVIDCQPPTHITFEHRATWKSQEQIVVESYEISPSGNGVEVVQNLDMTRAGIPWVFRILIRLIHRFGTPRDEPFLETLKRLAEQRSANRQ